MEIIELRILAMIMSFVLISFLVACIPNEKDTRLNSNLIPNYLNELGNHHALNRLPYQAWWTDFNDPHLNQLVAKALCYNNDVTIARNSIQVAHAQLNTIRLNWLPGVAVLTGFSQNPALGNPGVFYGILPSYYLNFFTLYFQQKTAELSLKRTKAYYLGTRLTVIGEVVSSYFSLLAWTRQLTLLARIERDYKKLLISLEIAQKQGLTNNIQILTVMSGLQQVSGQYKEIQSNMSVSENALHYLMNEPPGALKPGISLIGLPSKPVPYHKINLQVIVNRPDVMVALASLQAASSGVSVTTSQLLPSMTLDYLGGKASLNGSLSSPTSTVRYNDAYATFNVSPSIFGTIFTSKAIFRRSLAQYNKVIQNALRLIANSIDTHQKLTTKYHQDYSSFLSLKRRYRLEEALYHQGLISHDELLYQRIALNQQDYKLTVSKLEQLISVVRLYEELAAGILASASPTLNRGVSPTKFDG